jgi:hypothetical protein
VNGSSVLHVRSSCVDAIGWAVRDRTVWQNHRLWTAKQQFFNGNDLLAIACALQLREDGSHLGLERVFVAAVQHTVYLLCQAVSEEITLAKRSDSRMT